ncbi:MAG: CSLREA domain-containing protein, partial [Candidatus Methylomirabilis sp.]|nr:CSLREA domain-containing protein [Deltaproteobacteria bacterium]
MVRLSGVFWAVLLAAALAAPSAALAVTFTVTKTDDTADGTCDADCSLREAVIAANSAPGIRNVISIPAGTYTLSIARTTADATTGDLDILRTVDVVGAGRDDTIVDGGGLDGVFYVKGSNLLPGIRVRFKRMTIQNGHSATDGGAINIDLGYARTYVLDCAILDNIADRDGGGVSTYGYTLTLLDSLIEGNSASRGGGVSHFYNYAQSGLIRRSVVRDNT